MAEISQLTVACRYFTRDAPGYNRHAAGDSKSAEHSRSSIDLNATGTWPIRAS